jgi:hypothetical protein
MILDCLNSIVDIAQLDNDFKNIRNVALTTTTTTTTTNNNKKKKKHSRPFFFFYLFMSYHSFWTYLLKMCLSEIVYIYMHSALTGVLVLVTRTPEHAHGLVHFCWGLLIVTAEKGTAIEISYSDARSLVGYSFLGFIL